MGAFFINRPVFARVLAILIVLVGLVSLFVIPVSQFPPITPPTVQVSATYPGATSNATADMVTIPLETQINGVEGMIYMSSNSTNNGNSQITVTFDVGYDLNIAAVDTQNREQIGQSQTPSEVQRSGITVKKQSTAMVVVVALKSTDNSLSGYELSNYADIYVTPALSRVAGVGNVNNFGLQQYSMRLWLDNEKLASLNLTPNDVVNAVNRQNKQAVPGAIGAQPSIGRPAFQIQMTAKGLLTTAEEFDDIVVATGSNGALVRVRDVGRSELGASSYSTTATVDGRPAAVLGVYQLPTANAYAVKEGVAQAIEQLKSQLPAGVETSIVYDSTLFVTASIHDLVKTMVEAGLLVLLVIFIFLQDWRATLIPMISIPESILGAFAVMYFSGFSANTLTLLGLVLAIGLVVDDAIVVVENVHRQLELGEKNSYAAAAKAMREVTGPIVATSLILLAVFIPAALMPGITGALYNQFAMTIVFSVAISMVHALTLTPPLAGMLLRAVHHSSFEPFVLFNKGFEKFLHGYTALVTTAIKWRWAVAMIAVAAAAGGFLIFTTLSPGFLPDEDQGYFFVAVQLPTGASLPRTDEVCKKALKILEAQPEVERVVQVGGYNFLTTVPGTNAAFMIPVLKPWDQREGPEHTAAAVMLRVQPELVAIPEGAVAALPPPAIQGLGQVGGFQIQLLNTGNIPPDAFAQVAGDFIATLSLDPSVARAFTPYRNDMPMLKLDIDRVQVETLRADVGDVLSGLQEAFGSFYINNLALFGKVYKVMVQTDAPERMKVSDLTSLFIRNSEGKMIPISAFTGISATTAPDNRLRYNLFDTIPVSGVPKPGHSAGEGVMAATKLAETTLPSGVGFAWTGIVFQQLQAGAKSILIFIFSIICVYLLLAAQYESWMLPFAVMISVPLAVMGAFAALAIAGRPFDIYAQIGLVMLVGLATKNAILVVEFGKDLREEGKGIIEAAVMAAQRRVRAILMTAFSFILGVVPLIIATGAGAQARHSIGVTVFGGMLAATVLTLVVVPVVFTMIEGLREWSGTDPVAVAARKHAKYA